MVIWKMFYFKHLLQNHTISKATLLDKTRDTLHRLSAQIFPARRIRGSAQNKHSFSFFWWRYLSVIFQRRVLKKKINPKEKHESFKGAQKGPVQEWPPLQHCIIRHLPAKRWSNKTITTTFRMRCKASHRQGIRALWSKPLL